MARIGLTNGFSIIPEGTHIFKIVEVSYKEDFGKLEIAMQTQTNNKHIERFSLLRSDGTPNEGAYNAFSYFARVAMNDFNITDIDPEDLVGHYLECDVSHDIVPNKNKPGQNITFVRLGEKRSSDGWETVQAPVTTAPAETTDKPAKPAMDLKSLLG